MRSGLMESSAIEMTTFVEGGGNDDRESSNATTVTDANVNAVDANGKGGSDQNAQKATNSAANGGKAAAATAKNGFHFR